MNTKLFLSIALVLTVFHLCKAGPLRHLQKRAIFYIANETACVVDNIVYSSGDPIPTDDPCEACKCRPPGFACVLKECKIKAGCRAVRHAGECCPEYICGCEHNGIFYKDGEEIIDPKNPCYQCYCQGSAIACAFVDCIYRDECVSVSVPGECCPQYTNCTIDIPDRNPPPPADIVPVFTDIPVRNPPPPADIVPVFTDIPVRNPPPPADIVPVFTDIPVRNPSPPADIVPVFTDIPVRNPRPPADIVPAFNDEDVLPKVPSTSDAKEFFETPTNPINEDIFSIGKKDVELFDPQELQSNAEKILSSETSGSEEVSSEIETTQPEILETESKSSNTAVTEKDIEPLESAEVKQDTPKENESKEAIESAEEIIVSLNSETNIHKEDVAENLETQDLKLSTELEKELPQATTIGSKLEIADEVETTEKPSEIELTSTEITEKDREIKNSASENGKSLKLSNNDELDKTVKEEQNTKPDEKEITDLDEATKEERDTKTNEKEIAKLDEAMKEEQETKPDEKKITELAPESTSIMPTDSLKESSTIASKPESGENVVEESQTNAQVTPFNINKAKIKSESAETVTIIVHVKESSKISTETDFVAETVPPLSGTSILDETLLKSNDEIVKNNSNKKTSEDEDNKSTNTNFEIFPTTKQIKEVELTSKSPSTDQVSEGIEERSNEADNLNLEAEENPVNEEKLSDLKNEVDPLLITTMSAIEVANEVRSDEEMAEETKVDEPTNTVIRIDTSKPITIAIVTDSESSPKPEMSTESEYKKTEGLTGETKNENTEELIEEPKNAKDEEAVSEVREDSVIIEEKVEEPVPVQTGEEPTTEKEKSAQVNMLESTTEKEILVIEEKTEQSTEKNNNDKPEIRTDKLDTESAEEKTNIENTEEKTTKDIKSETTTESQNQTTEASKQTTLSAKH